MQESTQVTYRSRNAQLPQIAIYPESYSWFPKSPISQILTNASLDAVAMLNKVHTCIQRTYKTKAYSAASAARPYLPPPSRDAIPRNATCRSKSCSVAFVIRTFTSSR